MLQSIFSSLSASVECFVRDSSLGFNREIFFNILTAVSDSRSRLLCSFSNLVNRNEIRNCNFF